MSLLSLCVLCAQVSGLPDTWKSSCVSSSSSSRSSMLRSTGGLCLGVTVLSGTAFAIKLSLLTLHVDAPYLFMFIRSPMLPLTYKFPDWRFILDKAGECGNDSEHFSVDLTTSGRTGLLCSLSNSDRDDPRRILDFNDWFFFAIRSFSRFTLFEDKEDFIANKPAFRGNSSAHSVDFSRASISIRTISHRPGTKDCKNGQRYFREGFWTSVGGRKMMEQGCSSVFRDYLHSNHDRSNDSSTTLHLRTNCPTNASNRDTFSTLSAIGVPFHRKTPPFLRQGHFATIDFTDRSFERASLAFAETDKTWTNWKTRGREDDAVFLGATRSDSLTGSRAGIKAEGGQPLTDLSVIFSLKLTRPPGADVPFARRPSAILPSNKSLITIDSVGCLGFSLSLSLSLSFRNVSRVLSFFSFFPFENIQSRSRQGNVALFFTSLLSIDGFARSSFGGLMRHWSWNDERPMITKLMAGGETLAAEGDTTNSNAAIRYTGFRLRLGRLAYIDCGPTRSYRGKRTSLWRQRTCPACQCCVSFRKADGTLSSATFLFCFFFASFKNFFIFSFFSFFFRSLRSLRRNKNTWPICKVFKFQVWASRLKNRRH